MRRSTIQIQRAALAVATVAMLFCMSPRLVAQEFIVNGDFEQDLDLWVVWPGYISGTDANGNGPNPFEISEWFGSGGIGINPVQASDATNPMHVTGITGSGQFGINPTVPDGVHDDSAPFRDNGDNDTTVLFMQGTAAVQKRVSGLTVGQNYTLTLEYNARDCCGDFPQPELRLNGTLIPEFPDPQSSPDGVVLPVGDVNPWYFVEYPIAAESNELTIEIATQSELGLDSTFLVDNLELIPAGGGNNLVVNGDFEADADTFEVWPGYINNDNTRAPFRDNGNNRTAVAFMQGAASIEQDISGLTVGEEYVFSFEYNSRNCCGDIPIAEVALNDMFLDDFAGLDGVEPVGGNNDWYRYETTVVADSSTITARFSTYAAEGGDATFVLDNVSFRVASAALPGDFNNNGVLDSGDIDELTRQSASALNDLTFDLNADGLVDANDVDFWISDLFNSWVGDANLDKQFNSNDLVQMLAAGTYESNATAVWSQGDFDGNGLANSSDLVAALSGGGYENGLRPAIGAVPEPSSLMMIILGATGVVLGASRRSGRLLPRSGRCRQDGHSCLSR